MVAMFYFQFCWNSESLIKPLDEDLITSLNAMRAFCDLYDYMIYMIIIK